MLSHIIPRLPTSTVLAIALSLSTQCRALNPIEVQGQDFVDSATGDRFEILGIDYQPGGSAGYNPGSGFDPLSNATACLRDAVLMQQLGLNTLRVYNLDPDLNHDECASIFNAAGLYMVIDVNSPLPNESINQADPASSYNLVYLNRTFAVVDAFRGYPNTLGFFSANEVINDDNTGKIDPPYIRAVTRDLKNYIAARGDRQVPVGYSAADVRNILADTNAYVSCTTTGNASDPSRSDFFGLNSYSWCYPSDTLQTSAYDQLISIFSETTIPVFFSEYGCNKVNPRTFPEVPVIYGPDMTVFSGGLVYQWTQDVNNFGLVTINGDGSAQLLPDYVNLQTQYSTLNLSLIETRNTTAVNLTPATCDASLISDSGFSNNFDTPDAPSGVASLISAGVNGNSGSIVSVTQTSVSLTVIGVQGTPLSNLVLRSVSSANAPITNTGSASFITTGTGSASGGTPTPTATSASTSTSSTGAAAHGAVIGGSSGEAWIGISLSGLILGVLEVIM